MLNKELLHRMYIIERKTTTEIAILAGVRSTTSISNWLRKNGIPIRHGREAAKPVEPTEQQLRAMYCNELKSIDQIARELGSSENSVSMLLARHAIPIREKAWKAAGHNRGQPLPLWQRQVLSDYAKQRIGPKSPKFGKRIPEETKRKISKSYWQIPKTPQSAIETQRSQQVEGYSPYAGRIQGMEKTSLCKRPLLLQDMR